MDRENLENKLALNILENVFFKGQVYLKSVTLTYQITLIGIFFSKLYAWVGGTFQNYIILVLRNHADLYSLFFEASAGQGSQLTSHDYSAYTHTSTILRSRTILWEFLRQQNWSFNAYWLLNCFNIIFIIICQCRFRNRTLWWTYVLPLH